MPAQNSPQTPAHGLASHPHVRPQVGEPQPTHRHPQLLVIAAVGLALGAAGLAVAPWLAWSGFALAALSVVAFVVAPSPITAVGWQPPPAPASTPTGTMADAVVIAAGEVAGPEDVLLSADGRTLYASSFGDGRIVRIDVGGDGSLTEHALTGGSPVDLALDGTDGALFACDWSKGLLRISADGQVEPLMELGTVVDGRPFVRPDGVSVAADGTIYVSEGSDRPGYWNGVYEALEAKSYGRVIALDPATGVARTVMSGLSFANGVALDPEGRYLLASDQYRYRIARLWLVGQQAGQVDTFADNLPGLPHNLHIDADGLLWAGLYRLRDSTLDRISPRPRLKNLLAKLPAVMVAGPETVRAGKPGRGGVLALDSAGGIVHFLTSPPARVDTVSAAVRRGNHLYVGTLTGDAILRVEL